MKFFKQHITIMAALLGILFSACNKEDQEVAKAMQVIINGYNGSGHAWQVAIDTTVYDASSMHGKFIINPGAPINFNAVYTSPLSQQATLTLTDTSTQTVLFRKPLPASGTKALFNFIYFDGKELEITQPAADPATNKLGFYIRYTASDAPFDIFLYRKDATTGMEYRVYITKNAKPNTWIYADYIPTTDFDSKSDLDGAAICFTKAGTTDQWAFGDSEDFSKVLTFGMNFPLAGEKGIVLPYFLMPGPGKLDVSRLYFHADRPW
ncbi:hypothetical protein HF324_31170 [Chitinophaga oryzae]|uniref:DUF4843 domain-containing protein n=1 Tax=Chitinophaga oryzae TaxID=2725414 RepID=A0AAE7DAK6_9BACT|nr:hypothetical protein [Chitinophaga oryzae]QJB35523.1 hypothetical protein HF329_31150 [Chitinophaga oryzae]QJB42066.1 hypothetical protein HF324_31170 [Chitinophaga oryzae]